MRFAFINFPQFQLFWRLEYRSHQCASIVSIVRFWWVPSSWFTDDHLLPVSTLTGWRGPLLTWMPNTILKLFLPPTHVLGLGRFGSPNAQEGNASIREISYSSEELTVQTTLWLLWASHTTETTGRESGHCICQSDWAQMSRKNGFLLHDQGKEDYA